VHDYHSPFPQNQRYFAELASRINWSSDDGIQTINTHGLRRFRAIGDFLKTYELPEVLTWKAIDDARPSLGEAGQARAKFVRSCLSDLGQLSVERGLMQDRNSYLLERRLQCLESTPAIFRNHVGGFQEWVMGGMLNPRLQINTESVDLLPIDLEVLLRKVASVNAFLCWSAVHGITSLAKIDATVMTSYQEALFWKFECKKCGNCVPFRPRAAPEKCANNECLAIDSYAKARYFARGSRIAIASRLRGFFDYALLHGLIANNPVGSMGKTGPRSFTIVDERGKTIEISDAIRRYDDSVIKKLCAYIVSPQADPEEALILYLVIFHLLTPTELCNVKIPSLVKGGSSSASDGSEDYRHLILPLTKPTRHHPTVRRPEETIRFPREALPWLVPILERYYAKRRSQVQAPHHEYLLAPKGRSRHNKPVSVTYVFMVVQRASLRTLKGAVNISELRQTSAFIFAERSKRRFAVLTTMGYSAKWATRFNYLEAFILSPKKTTRTLQKT